MTLNCYVRNCSRTQNITFSDDGSNVIHYGDVIMGAIASQITSLTIVYSTVYSDADERKHQSSASLAFERGIDRSPHKWPVTRKMFPFPFDDVIMIRHEVSGKLTIVLEHPETLNESRFPFRKFSVLIIQKL